jgi:hypothetical protein
VTLTYAGAVVMGIGIGLVVPGEFGWWALALSLAGLLMVVLDHD